MIFLIENNEFEFKTISNEVGVYDANLVFDNREIQDIWKKSFNNINKFWSQNQN